MKNVVAIILAAGGSRRLGEPKQLVVLNGETLLERSLRIAREAGCESMFVVLGAHRERIESQVDLSAMTIVDNANWGEGMASSIRAGVLAVEDERPESAGVLLMVCDQPAIGSEHLRQMIGAFREQSECAIASVYAGTRGIPAIFPAEAFPDLRALRGDRGARGLLSDPGRKVVEVPLEGGELDVDLPEHVSRPGAG